MEANGKSPAMMMGVSAAEANLPVPDNRPYTLNVHLTELHELRAAVYELRQQLEAIAGYHGMEQLADPSAEVPTSTPLDTGQQTTAITYRGVQDCRQAADFIAGKFC